MSPFFINISSHPKSARVVLVSSFPVIANSGFTLITISATSCKSSLPLMVVGARSNLAYYSSSGRVALSGLRVALLLILILVDTSTYANCVYCSMAGFMHMKHRLNDSENVATLPPWSRNLRLVTWESVLRSLLRATSTELREIQVFLLVTFCSRVSLQFLFSLSGMGLLDEEV